MTPNTTKIICPDSSYQIMGAIFEVHKKSGPGFLGSVYEKALIEELSGRGVNVETGKVIGLTYKDKKIGAHRLDLVIEDKIVPELKTVESVSIHHRAQLISCLKASGPKLGIPVHLSKAKVEYRCVIVR